MGRKITRKRITMTVTVSVPVDMPAAEARKEVQSLISDQCNWLADPEDVKAVSIKPAKASQ